MILNDNARFFSAGAMTGSVFASLFCVLFPSISLYILVFYIVLAGSSLYKMKDEFHKLI
tara:strand:- start:107 stop:283 length:177 start_codon:yes stop_codon:yes gene_type:complete